MLPLPARLLHAALVFLGRLAWSLPLCPDLPPLCVLARGVDGIKPMGHGEARRSEFCGLRAALTQALSSGNGPAVEHKSGRWAWRVLPPTRR